MGLGVSRTVGRPRATPNADDLLGKNRNAILEIAESAQELSDATAPEDEFQSKYGRKEQRESKTAASGDEADAEDESLGM